VAVEVRSSRLFNDLHTQLTAVIDLLTSPENSAVTGLIAEALQDHELAHNLQERLIRPRITTFKERLRKARLEGQLAPQRRPGRRLGPDLRPGVPPTRLPPRHARPRATRDAHRPRPARVRPAAIDAVRRPPERTSPQAWKSRRQAAALRPRHLPSPQHPRTLLQPTQGIPRPRDPIRQDRRLLRSGGLPRLVSALGKIRLKTDPNIPTWRSATGVIGDRQFYTDI
jgi:hypothetical protein